MLLNLLCIVKLCMVFQLYIRWDGGCIYVSYKMKYALIFLKHMHSWCGNHQAWKLYSAVSCGYDAHYCMLMNCTIFFCIQHYHTIGSYMSDTKAVCFNDLFIYYVLLISLAPPPFPLTVTATASHALGLEMKSYQTCNATY